MRTYSLPTAVAQTGFARFFNPSCMAFTAATDFLLVVAANQIAAVCYRVDNFQAFAAVGVDSALLFVLCCKLLGLYRIKSVLSGAAQIRGVATAWGTVLLFVISLFFTLKVGFIYSRVAMLGFGILSLVFVASARATTRAGLRRALSNGTVSGDRVLLVGDALELGDFSCADMLASYGKLVIGQFVLSSSAGASSMQSEDDTMIDQLVSVARVTKIDQILLALPWNNPSRREAICQRLRVLPLPVYLLPDRFVRAVLTRPGLELAVHSPVELQRAPLSQSELFVKRILDLILATVGLLALFPLLTLIGMAIKVDSSGPIVFRQRRRGFNGREFTIYKFRTMTVLEDGETIRQTQRADKRVTRVGRFLRSTSMDELTQLINVLFGDMSLVGPRPHAVAHDSEYSATVGNYAFRHHVKPGITGWAQIHGLRGETAELDLMKQRIDLDLWYIKNWSFWLDLRILLRTCVEITRFGEVY
jgi:Undecaprenyl-phosphate glucose phosphotransferase